MNELVMTKKRIDVAVGVILVQDQILLAQRPKHLHKGGYWEFPGGKLEANESVQDALVREIEEELGVTPVFFEPLITVSHDYTEKNVCLDVWVIRDYLGLPVGRENQKIQWVRKSELENFELPEANLAIVEKLLNLS